jgi:hypothetical protein
MPVVTGGKHLNLDSAQTAHDPNRPEAEVAGMPVVTVLLADFRSSAGHWQ